MKELLKWSLAGALAEWEPAVEAAHRAGFLLSMYGSVLTRDPFIAHANDLDLIAVPKRKEVDWKELVYALVCRCGWRDAGEPARVSLLGAVSVQLMMCDRLIDLQIRGVDVGAMDRRFE